MGETRPEIRVKVESLKWERRRERGIEKEGGKEEEREKKIKLVKGNGKGEQDNNTEGRGNKKRESEVK